MRDWSLGVSEVNECDNFLLGIRSTLFKKQLALQTFLDVDFGNKNNTFEHHDNIVNPSDSSSTLGHHRPPATMSTIGQFSSKNPTIKRILKEASELATQPSSDYQAAPLETDLFEWHFTIRGPPSPSPFDGGIYHGRIVLPPAYPHKPPSFRFLTPTGRFEVNREICLSISGHHEETWQPAWGIRTALVAIRSFMDTDARGQLGGMDASEEVRKRLAGQSKAFKCGACGKSNEEIMQERDAAVQEHGGEGKKEVVPEELRLAYREDLTKEDGKSKESLGESANGTAPETNPPSSADVNATSQSTTEAASAAQSDPVTQPAPPAQQQQQQVQRRQNEDIPPWVDKAIYGVIAALIFLFWKKLGTWV